MRTDKEVTIEVDEELIQRLAELPNRGRESQRWPWTPEKDRALLKFWPTKRHDDVVRVLGCSRNTALRRYRELTESDAES